MYSVLQQQFKTWHCISINGKRITSTNSTSTCNNSIENYHKNLQATSAAAATKCKDKTTTVATTARTTTYHVDCCCPGDGWQTGDEGQKGHQNEDAAVSHF